MANMDASRRQESMAECTCILRLTVTVVAPETATMDLSTCNQTVLRKARGSDNDTTHRQPVLAHLPGQQQQLQPKRLQQEPLEQIPKHCQLVLRKRYHRLLQLMLRQLALLSVVRQLFLFSPADPYETLSSKKQHKENIIMSCD